MITIIRSYIPVMIISVQATVGRAISDMPQKVITAGMLSSEPGCHLVPVNALVAKAGFGL